MCNFSSYKNDYKPIRQFTAKRSVTGKRMYSTSREQAIDLIDFDWSESKLQKLDTKLLYCISSDKKSVVYTFNNFKEAALTLTPTKCKNLSDEQLNSFKGTRHLRRNVNIAQLTNTELGKFYIVVNPDTVLQKKLIRKILKYLC